MQINHQKLKKAVSFLHQSIENHEIPGAVALVKFQGEAILETSLGYSHFDRKIEMSTDTIFDLASLTKVCATLPAILVLCEAGEISFDDKVSRFLPHFSNETISIKNLLTHTSGLPPFLDFYSKKFTTQEAVKVICQFAPFIKPNEQVIYSDLNFILLGHIVGKITGLPLNQFVEEAIYRPLGMKNTFYNPDHISKETIAATEYNEEIQDYSWGVVHDENARNFGGISGHAGLFSNAHDLSLYTDLFMGSTSAPILSPFTIEKTLHNYTKMIGEGRGIGWQLNTDGGAGDLFPATGFGHTGFTGTSIWMDRLSQLSIILLTNRVHFGRKDHIIRIRKIFNNMVTSTLEG